MPRFRSDGAHAASARVPPGAHGAQRDARGYRPFDACGDHRHGSRAGPRAFDRFWGEICARAIGFLDLDLRRVKWPEDGQLYVGVVNKRAGETAKLATRLTAEQIALFRMVLDEILRDDHNAEHGVDVIAALNATQLWSQRDSAGAGPSQANGGLSQAQTQSVAKMSKVEKEATLKALCEDGWLKQGDDEAGGFGWASAPFSSSRISCSSKRRSARGTMERIM